MRSKSVWVILIAAAMCCAAMAVVDGIIQPGYVIKSAIKLTLFLGVPLVLSRFIQGICLKPLFRPKKQGLALALGLGVGLFSLILGGYGLLGRFIDFTSIAANLTANVAVDRDSFVYVAIYISFINSLLEEFFFRGFLFLTLRTLTGRSAAYLISAVLFALYHSGMMVGAVSLPLAMLGMVGLVIGGFIFNWLNEKQGNIYTSWLVHMFANFAINTIGFLIL